MNTQPCFAIQMILSALLGVILFLGVLIMTQHMQLQSLQ
jgi:hypothetical protein